MSVAPSFEREKEFLLRKIGWFKPAGAMLAGGAITSTFTNQSIADFDLYFKSKQAFPEAVRDAYEDGLWCVNSSGRAITFSDNGTIYQLMHFAFFESAADIFESFDFTCCMASLDLDTKEFEFHPTFLSDTSKRELVFNHRTAYPLASAMRLLKYQEKGFTIRKREMLKVIAACNMKAVDGWKALGEQIGGRYGTSAALNSEGPFCLEEVINAIDIMGEPTATNGHMDADAALAEIFGHSEVAA